MRTEDIKFGMTKAIEENPISDVLAEEALRDVLLALAKENLGASQQAAAMLGDGDSRHEILRAIKNTSILLSAADIMKGQPGLLEIFALAMQEIAPPPQASPLKEVVGMLIQMDIEGCGQPQWKQHCFQAYLNV